VTIHAFPLNAAPAAGPRSLHVITELSRLAACSCCPAAGPAASCVQRATADGMHVGRYAEARRRNLITAADFAAVIQAAGAFTATTVVFNDAFAEAA
jgi:hypothetical protein